MTRALALILLLAVNAALAHGDAEWIMRGPDRSCCGPKDCFEVEAETVKWRADGVYVVAWRGRNFEIPEAEAKKSERSKPWVCEMPDQTIRCLFVLPMGA